MYIALTFALEFKCVAVLLLAASAVAADILCCNYCHDLPSYFKRLTPQNFASARNN
jgi:hypothetical protein